MSKTKVSTGISQLLYLTVIKISDILRDQWIKLMFSSFEFPHGLNHG